MKNRLLAVILLVAMSALVVQAALAAGPTPVGINRANIDVPTNQISATGSGFSPSGSAPTATFGGTGLTVTAFTNTTLTANLPAVVTPGTYSFTISNSAKGSSTIDVTYSAGVGPVACTGTIPFNNASLRGTYIFQLSQPYEVSWSAQWSCQVGSITTLVGSGSTTLTTRSLVGTVTFDGMGNMTASLSQYGELDQEASNATIPQTCPVQSSGHAVFFPPITSSGNGTYSINQDGTGTAVLVGDENVTLLQLTGPVTSWTCAGNSYTEGVRSTVLLTTYNPSDRSVHYVGIAQLRE